MIPTDPLPMALQEGEIPCRICGKGLRPTRRWHEAHKRCAARERWLRWREAHPPTQGRTGWLHKQDGAENGVSVDSGEVVG
jgi:hypothetical protein